MANLTASELKAHASKEDLYLAIHGKVYNATEFASEHPGGDSILIEVAGTDASEAWDDVGHSYDAQELLTPLYVADLS